MTSPRAKQLVLTARREFWPTGGEAWLVSPMCALPAEPDVTQTAEVKGVIAFPWNHGNLAAVHAAVSDTFEMALGHLANGLNEAHGVRHGLRYWRIVLGPWLLQYLNLLMHHDQSLANAKAALGRLETIGLSEEFHVTPASTLDFIYESTDDLYNLQLYTRLAALNTLAVAEHRKPSSSARLGESANPENLVRPEVGFLKRGVARAAYEIEKLLQRLIGSRVRVLLRRSYLPRSFERRLTAVSRGRVWAHVNGDYRAQKPAQLDQAMRGQLEGFDGVAGSVSQYLNRYLAGDVPSIFVENYHAMAAFSDEAYGRYRPRAILSTAAWFTDHAFGHFAGTRADQGTRLVGGQHGGDFGVEAQSQLLDFERSLVDDYLTWGWSDSADAGLLPTPANRLVGSRRRPERTSGEGILYVATVALRYPLIARGDFSGYSALQSAFFSALDPDVRKNFRVRLHTSDFGWGIERQLRAAFPDLVLEDWQAPFDESLQRARLYVSDHISTTFVDALATNTPMILFWDPVFFAVRRAAEPLFEQARAARIVHSSPQSAAEWIGRVYPDVEDWWSADETQRAADGLRDAFARTSDDPLAEWLALLDRFGGPAPGQRLTTSVG